MAGMKDNLEAFGGLSILQVFHRCAVEGFLRVPTNMPEGRMVGSYLSSFALFGIANNRQQIASSRQPAAPFEVPQCPEEDDTGEEVLKPM
jgi:hypothetical protein